MKSLQNELTPVLMLEAKHHGGLNIARSLGRLGAPIYLVDLRRLEPVLFSCYFRKRSHWDLEARKAEDSVRFLLEGADKIGRRPVLMATDDHAALFVADHAEALSHSYLFAGQSALRSHSLITKLSLLPAQPPAGPFIAGPAAGGTSSPLYSTSG